MGLSHLTNSIMALTNEESFKLSQILEKFGNHQLRALDYYCHHITYAQIIRVIEEENVNHTIQQIITTSKYVAAKLLCDEREELHFFYLVDHNPNLCGRLHRKIE